MNLIEKYKGKGETLVRDNQENRGEVRKSFFQMLEQESEFDFIAIESREKLGRLIRREITIHRNKRKKY